jgi:hypothetical protein
MYIWAPYQNGSSVSTSLPLISFASASRRTLLGRHGFDDLPSQWLETTWNAHDFRSSRAAVHCSATWKPHSHTWYIRIWRAKTNTDLIRKCTMNVPWMSIDICQQQVLASLLPVADVLPLRLCPMCHHQSPAGAWCSTAFPVAGSFKALTCPAYESIAESNGCYWVLWINFE